MNNITKMLHNFINLIPDDNDRSFQDACTSGNIHISIILIVCHTLLGMEKNTMHQFEIFQTVCDQYISLLLSEKYFQKSVTEQNLI